MSTKELVGAFETELGSILQSDPPISKSKMESIRMAAMKANTRFKIIVHTVEKFIAKCEPKYKLPALHVIDSIVRQSLRQFGPKRDVYVERFSTNLEITFEKTMGGCAPSDRMKMVRILTKWSQDHIFTSETLRPLFGIAKKISTKNGTKISSSSKIKSVIGSQILSAGAAVGNKDGHRKEAIGQHTRVDSNANRQQAGISRKNTQAEPSSSSSIRGTNHELRACKKEPITISDSVSKDRVPLNIKPDESTGRTHDYGKTTTGRLSRSSSINSDNIDYDTLLIESKRSRRASRTPSPKSERSSNVKFTSSLEKPAPPERTIRVSPKIELISTELPFPVTSINVSVDSSDIPQKFDTVPERQRRCLPPLRPNHLTVCSSTLWVAHLPRSATEADISDVFGMFGTITSIHLVISRGCAYVNMDRRQDASRIISQSENMRLLKNKIKIAWAPGKGISAYSNLKDFWHTDIGASYIPHGEITNSMDLDMLEEGGVIDDESLTPEMRARRKKTRESLDSIDMPMLCQSSLIPQALMIQQQFMNSVAGMPACPPIQSPVPSLVPNSLGFLPNTTQSQLAHLGQLPSPNLVQRELQRGAAAAMEQHHINSIYQAQANLPPHLMLNNPYLQSMAALHQQASQLPFGLHLPPPPSGLGGHFLPPNYRPPPTQPGDTQHVLPPELLRGMMYSLPHQEMMQHSSSTSR